VMVIAHSFREERPISTTAERRLRRDRRVALGQPSCPGASPGRRAHRRDDCGARLPCRARGRLLLHSVPVCSAQWTARRRTLWGSIDPATLDLRAYGGSAATGSGGRHASNN
jgi:hypothetical protein